MSKRDYFTSEFKAQVILQVLTGAKRSAKVCREHELGAPLLSNWKTAFLEQAAACFRAMNVGVRSNPASPDWSGLSGAWRPSWRS